MKKLILLAVSIVIISSSFTARAASQFKMIHAQDLATLMKTAHPYVADANNTQTRTDYGVVPGAHLLSSSASYDISKELPADKKTTLVFYCANTQCGASHSAAERAMTAGYSDVSVMTDGIMGWKTAGNPTTTFATKK